MSSLEQVKKIISGFDLALVVPENCENLYKYEGHMPDFVPALTDGDLIEKYKDHIPAGWYGFSIGTPTPKKWVEVLDKILEFLIKEDPNFTIHQIKMKFGGIRFYCASEIISDLNEIESLIEKSMFDQKLVY